MPTASTTISIAGSVAEVARWAHCRRYFIQALESDAERARQALAPMAALFRIERCIATVPRKKEESVVSNKSKNVVDRFFARRQRSRDEVFDELPKAKPLATLSTNRSPSSASRKMGACPCGTQTPSAGVTAILLR